MGLCVPSICFPVIGYSETIERISVITTPSNLHRFSTTFQRTTASKDPLLQ
jgi:hypothetical protein